MIFIGLLGLLGMLEYKTLNTMAIKLLRKLYLCGTHSLMQKDALQHN